MKNKFIYLSLLAAGLIACEPEFDNEVSNSSYSAGDADFTSYVAIGNSLTAGYMDGTVSRVSQSYSFPNLLSQQFAVVGGGAFTQPSYEDDINNAGGLLLGGNQIAATRLIIDATAGGPEPLAAACTIEVSSLQATAYNNMGVPGAKSFHLLAPGYGNLAGVALGQANPYFVRHATSPSTTVMADAMSKNPTFFTNWIGSNDVLAFATSGGVGVDQTGNFHPSTYGSNDITDPNVFASVYSGITDMLTIGGAKGVVATVPNVTSIPFFTTVPYNPLTTSVLGGGNSQAGAAAMSELNGTIYAFLDQVFTALGQPNRINPLSVLDTNPLLIKDEAATNFSAQITAAAGTIPQFAPYAAFLGQTFGQARQATANDLILLTTRSVIGTAPAGIPAPFDKFGVTYPLQDNHVLTEAEIEMVNTATLSYNQTIKAIAASKGLAVADMNAILNQLVSGLRVEDGQIYTADYFSTSALNTTVFSLDGVHPNARGYAAIANEVIKVINKHYNANLPLIVPGYYPGATVLPTN